MKVHLACTLLRGLMFRSSTSRDAPPPEVALPGHLREPTSHWLSSPTSPSQTPPHFIRGDAALPTPESYHGPLCCTDQPLTEEPLEIPGEMTEGTAPDHTTNPRPSLRGIHVFSLQLSTDSFSSFEGSFGCNSEEVQRTEKSGCSLTNASILVHVLMQTRFLTSYVTGNEN